VAGADWIAEAGSAWKTGALPEAPGETERVPAAPANTGTVPGPGRSRAKKATPGLGLFEARSRSVPNRLGTAASESR